MRKEKIRQIKKHPRGGPLLRALQATGLFRWEKPVTKAEAACNIWTHGIGMGLAIGALCVLECYAVLMGDAWAVVSCAIFGATMFMLYFGSTMCHAMVGQKYDSFFEVWDSIAIYALIAGTYTPFLLINLRGWAGWMFFGILWAVVIFGAVMKIALAPTRQPKWMVALYLIMGWAVVFVLPQMLRSVSARGLWFIVAGGLSYTVGVGFYLWRKMKFSHAIWHLLVIAGTVSFFFAVLFGSIIDYAK